MINSFPKNYARYNMNYRTYSKIATTHFTIVKEIFDDLSAKNFIMPLPYSCFNFEENSMITVVFSAMALESFLNDYAATCLGDSLFYGTFDKLSIVEKFELIVLVILKKDLDKGKSYYNRLKTLVKDRNNLIHNKSRSFFETKDFDDLDTIIDEEFLNVKKSSKLIFNPALNAINALKEISLFFDEIDTNSNSRFRLLGMQ